MIEKKLFDFVAQYPLAVSATRVIATQKTWRKPVPLLQELREKQEKVQAVYLASGNGYQNYCAGCSGLAMCQETGFSMMPIRVFCFTEACLKK